MTKLANIIKEIKPVLNYPIEDPTGREGMIISKKSYSIVKNLPEFEKVKDEGWFEDEDYDHETPWYLVQYLNNGEKIWWDKYELDVNNNKLP